MEQTLSIIKPDAVADGHIGEIIARFEKAGLKPVAMKMVQLTEEQAKAFYLVHVERPFYMDLVRFVIEGPVVVMVLEGEGAVALNRQLMGATNPKDAALGTIRKDFAESIERNVVHGSDSRDNAKQEILFFFKPSDIHSPIALYRGGGCGGCGCHH
jgi:nucleoside-diphosphate kinase